MAQFPKGKSGNPGGRPAGIRTLLRGKYGDDAKLVIEGIHKIAFASGKAVGWRTKLDALKTLLAYQVGPPPQSVELTGEDGQAIGPITFVVRRRA